jgi:hypothetical protein
MSANCQNIGRAYNRPINSFEEPFQSHRDIRAAGLQCCLDRRETGSFCSIDCAMTRRVRHCLECPKCRTRYLVGFSPYRNGSYLVSQVVGFSEEWTLYCSCGRPPISSRWRWNELKMYAVSNQAYALGYGAADEIADVKQKVA